MATRRVGVTAAAATYAAALRPAVAAAIFAKRLLYDTLADARGAPAEAAPHTAAALTLLRGGGAAAGVALPPTQFVRAAELMLLGVRPRPLQTCPCFQASCR